MAIITGVTDLPLHDIYLNDENHGWAVGVQGLVLRTYDGANWIGQNMGKIEFI
jgi:photosystem II stability/assembly factor-like uncharacterized protein